MAHPHSSITLGDNHRGFQLGQNFGHVHVAPGALSLISPRRPCRANRDVLLERPETPPEPSSQVPFRRDPHFVERARLTDQIRAKLLEPAGRAALVGLGGVGYGVHGGGTMAAALTRVKEVTARDRVRAPAVAAVAADVGAVDSRKQCGALRAERARRGGSAQDLREKGSKGRPPAAPTKLAARQEQGKVADCVRQRGRCGVPPRASGDDG